MNVETVIFIVVMTCLFLLVIVSFLVASSMFVYHLYMNFKNAPPKQLARQAIAPAAEPAQATIPGRNPYYTPVMVLSGNVPGKDFYAILAFVPPGHQQTNVMRQEFLKAVQGLADYSIITEQVALEKGLRYGGVAYLSELNIPKVV